MDKSVVMGRIDRAGRHRILVPWLVGCAGLGVLTWFGTAFTVYLQTMGFLYLLVVVMVAMLGGFWPASLTSLVAAASLDYFFIPPILHFDIADPQDWVALGAFEVTALVVSRLSAKEMRNAREAAIHRAGMEQLYELSRSSLLLDLRQPPGPQLALLILRIFDARAVALFDINLGRQDRAGEWGVGEENLARECYLRATAQDDSETQTSQRILSSGSGAVGALVVRGMLSPLIVDALASLAAIAIDRHQSFEHEDRAETAMRGEQLRATVMDALAHEFKTPLTAVQTASSGLLELGGLTDSQADLVTLIDDEVTRLNKLCTRLLQTAKLNSEQVDLETAEVNLQELVAEVLAGRSANVERNSIEVAVDYPGLMVRADRGLLAMILAQYIDNARKYSAPDTPIKITVQTSHNEVLISVHNFGSTIRIEERERIFDRFYRSPDLKDSIPGTGIGLSVVKKAAEAHHGHVWVISDNSQGTTFYCSLPIGVRRVN